MPEDKLTLEQFGQKIKAKYPEYKDMPDIELANKILDKFPVYQDMVMPPVKKKEQVTESPSGDGSLDSKKSNPLLDVGKDIFKQPYVATREQITSTETPKFDPFKGPLVRPTDTTTDATRQEKPFVPNDPVRATQEDFNKSLKTITSDFVGKEEEYVVPELNYRFKEHGFKFEETGIGDAMIATAPNGKTLKIDLNPFKNSTENSESKKLQDFINNNQRDSKLAKSIAAQDAYNKKFLDQKEIDESLGKLNNEQKAYSDELASLSKIPKGTQEYNDKAALLEQTQRKLEANKKVLQSNIGKYVYMKSQQGTYSGGIYNALLEGVGSVGSGLVGLVIETNPMIPDVTKKVLKNAVLPDIRESLVSTIGDKNVSKEWSENAGFVHQAILGLARSVPAMVGGAEAMLPLMYLQVSDDLDKQMSEDSRFDNISEEEKLLVKAPVGIAVAALEKFGFRNAIAQKGLLNGVVLRAIGKSTANTTAKSFSELIEQDIKSEITKGVLRVGAGGLAEFETGAAQQVVDISAKQIYNLVKDKKMFETPDGVGSWVKDVFIAGAQEAVGGFVLGAPGAISKAYANNDFKDVDNASIDILSATGNDPTINQAIDLDLKTKVATGELTPEEAAQQQQDYQNTVGLMNDLDTEGMSPDQKKRALTVAKKLKDLKDRKEGKLNQTEKDKEEIKKLQQELNSITDAIQESKPEEGVLRPEQPEVGLQGVGEGNAKEQATTKETAQKEVTTLINQKVEFKGEKGFIRQDEGGKLTFETDDKIVELSENDVAAEAPKVEVKGNTVKIGEDAYEFVSTNTDKNGAVVSVTLKDSNGKEITKRDADLALDIGLAKANDMLNSSDISPQDAAPEIAKSFTEEHSEKANDVIESMPESVVDAIIDPNADKAEAKAWVEKQAESSPDKDVLGIFKDILKNINEESEQKRPTKANADVKAEKVADVKPTPVRSDKKNIPDKQDKKAELPTVEKPLPKETKEAPKAKTPKPVEMVLWHEGYGPETKGDAVYLESEEAAKSVSNNAKPYRVKLENPYLVSKDGDFDLIKGFIKEFEKNNPKSKWHPDTTGYVNKKLKELGYDGLIIEQSAIDTDKGYEDIESSYGNAQVVVFNKANVKAETPKPVEPEKPTEEKVSTKYVEKPLDEIFTDEARFQNRTELDQEHVDRIAENWKESSLTPIDIWKDPKNGKTYILAGHHRQAAAKKLGKETITARYFEGTESEAIKYAKEESNANRLMESPLERAAIYRKMRQEGATNKEIDKALEVEGKNNVYVKNLSFLNHNGKIIQMLVSLQGSTDKQTVSLTEQAADWIGNARRFFPNLTNSHENELYDWLVNKGALSKIRTKAEFNDRIGRVVNDTTRPFNPSEPLNIENRTTRGSNESEKLREIKEVVSQIEDLEKERKNTATEKRLNEITDEINDHNITLARLNKELKAAKEGDKLQVDMFGEVNTAIKNNEITGKQADGFLESTEDIDSFKAISASIEAKTESSKEASLVEAIQEADKLIGEVKPTDAGKMLSASSRFKPAETVVFEKPIVGPNGNKLVSYNWAYEWTMKPNREGELKDKRVSDWSQAESSAETGRDLVHKFVVERKDGTAVTVSSESIPEILGYVDAKEMKNLPSVVSAVKTLAKQRMQLAILKAQEAEYRELQDKYSNAKKPEVEVVGFDPKSLEYLPFVKRLAAQKGEFDDSQTYFRMGDVVQSQHNKSSYENGKTVYARNETPSQQTISDLESSWVDKRVKEDGGKYPQGLYELERRIERQEKKVQQATKRQEIKEPLKEQINENKVEDPETGLYKTESEGVSFLSESGNADYSTQLNLFGKSDKNKNSSHSIVAVWNKLKDIQFTGTTRVKNAEDVAHIMRLLEDKSVEHAFAVHIDASGNSHIQFLSIGGVTGTVIDSSLVMAGISKFKSKKIYLVHNHPSGNLKPSDADIRLTDTLRAGLHPLNIELEHVIMDTYHKQYIHIDLEGSVGVKGRFLGMQNDVKITTHVMNEQKVLEQPSIKVTSSSNAVDFIQQLRFTAMPKNAMLVLDRINKIIGNYVFQDGITHKEIVNFIGNSGIGRAVIFYGNNYNKTEIGKIKDDLRNFDVSVHDYIVTGSNTESIKQYYSSMADQGLLAETQEKYGTNIVNEPSLDKRTEKLIAEIQSKPLTRAYGTGMGMNEMEGTFISTEALNRYGKESKDLKEVSVDIKNPYELKNADELIDLQNKALEKAKQNFAKDNPEINDYQDFLDAETIDDGGLELAYNLGLKKYIAEQVTQDLKDKGHDSAYLRESEDSEGMLVVFDKSKVTAGESIKGLTPDEQIQRGKEKLLNLITGKGGVLRDITSLPAEILEAITDIAIGYAKKGGNALKDFIAELRSKAGEYLKNISDKELTDLFNKANGIEEKAAVDIKEDEVKKTIATVRAYEGDVREGVKKEIENLGLTRNVESQKIAKAKAKEFIESVGEEHALEAVRNNDVPDAAGAYVWNELIERVDKKLSLENNPTEQRRLEILQAQLFDEFSRKALSGGRFASALNDIYQSSDLGYNVEKKIQEYKDVNQGVIPPEVEAKFRDLDAQYKEVKTKLAEAEQRAKKAEGELAIKNIQEARSREPKASSKIRKDTDWVVAKVREAKIHRPGMFAAATPASLVWDGAIETVATAIKLTGRGAEAIVKGLEYVKQSDWYKSLSDSDKRNAESEFKNFWKDTNIENLKPFIKDGVIKIPSDLIYDLVEKGSDTIESLVSDIKGMMIEEYPDITDREIRDAITEYGRVRNLNKDEIATEIRKIKRIGRIVSALEDVNRKKRPLRSGIQRDKLDAQERALNKELREAMKDLPLDAELEAEQQKTATDAAKTRIQNQIEDLQREIDKGERVPRSTRTITDDAELVSLKSQRDKLKAEHEAIFKDEEFRQAKRLELTKRSTQKKLEDLSRRIREGDFSKKSTKPVIADSELIDLRADKLRLQEQYDKEIYKAKLINRKASEKVKDALWDAWGLLRLLRATGEFSFVLIQGLKYTIAHPIYAAKAFITAMKFFGSEAKTDAWLRSIKAQEWYPEAKMSKLAITEVHAELLAREELFYADSANMIWNAIISPLKLKSEATYQKWKKRSPFNAFERASVGYLNTIRVLRFLDGKQMLNTKGVTFENNPEAFKQVADVINTFTGRASIGALERVGPALTKIFFSPRNWASVFKTATPYAFYHFGKMRAGAKGIRPSVAQKMAISDFSKFVGLTTSLVALAALYYNDDDDDETSVEMNPTSSDFGKIKIGRTRIDPWGGSIQQVVLLARIIADSVKKESGDIVPLGVPFRTPTRKELLIEIATNKLTPSASLIDKYLSSRVKGDGRVDKYGNPYSFTEDFKNNLYPIYYETVNDLLKDDPSALDGLLIFYSFFGGGVSTYDKKEPKQTERKTRPTRPTRPSR